VFKTDFLHHNTLFGIIVDDWGDASGAQIAASELEHWVRSLSASATKAIHGDLVKSDAAWGDNPIFDNPAMSALNQAALAARRVGMRSSDERLNEGHDCTCQLVPITG
jgi:mevalonate pyrophosphate decarboxylase